MPATTAVSDRAEDAIIKPPCKKSLRFGSRWALANGTYPAFQSLGIRHLPGSSRRSLLQLQYTLKSCRFQKWFPTNCPVPMVADAAEQTSPTRSEENTSEL